MVRNIYINKLIDLKYLFIILIKLKKLKLNIYRIDTPKRLKKLKVN